MFFALFANLAAGNLAASAGRRVLAVPWHSGERRKTHYTLETMQVFSNTRKSARCTLEDIISLLCRGLAFFEAAAADFAKLSAGFEESAEPQEVAAASAAVWRSEKV
jgi:hypothetical protein